MNAFPKSSHGLGMVQVILLIPLFLIALFVLTYGFYEARKAYWDYQVDKLCAQDGGVKINEVMYLDKPEYERLIDKKFGTGEVVVPQKGSADSAGAAAVYIDEMTFIRRGSPAVSKYVLSIVRTSDDSVIATRTSYGRGDGDLMSLQPSSHSCPQLPNTFFASVIKLKGSNK